MGIFERWYLQMYTRSEYIALKKMEAIAKKAKDLQPIRKSVLKEINETLKIHEN
jgi:hypothetical protein